MASPSSKFDGLATENQFEPAIPSYTEVTQMKPMNDEFHRILILEKMHQPLKPTFNMNLTCLYIENYSLKHLKTTLIKCLSNLETTAKGKIYLIRFAAGLSILLKSYHPKCKENLICCKRCRLSFPFGHTFDEIEDDFLKLIKSIEQKFFNAVFIPTAIVHFDIESFYDELLADHISCCSHLFPFLIDGVHINEMQHILDINITKFNKFVNKYCKKNDHQIINWKNKEVEDYASLSFRHNFYVKKLEEVLYVDFNSAKKMKGLTTEFPFCPDESGTIEFRIEDFDDISQKSDDDDDDWVVDDSPERALLRKENTLVNVVDTTTKSIVKKEINAEKTLIIPVDTPIIKKEINTENTSVIVVDTPNKCIIKKEINDENTSVIAIDTPSRPIIKIENSAESFPIAVKEIAVGRAIRKKNNVESVTNSKTDEEDIEVLHEIKNDIQYVGTSFNKKKISKVFDKLDNEIRAIQVILTDRLTNKNLSSNCPPIKLRKKRGRQNNDCNQEHKAKRVEVYSTKVLKKDFISLDLQQAGQRVENYIKIGSIGKPMSNNIRKREWQMFFITDGTTNDLNKALCNANESVYQVLLKSIDNTDLSFCDQVDKSLESLSYYISNKNMINNEKKIVLFVNIGTHEFKRQLYINKDGDVKNICNNITRILERFKKAAYEVPCVEQIYFLATRPDIYNDAWVIKDYEDFIYYLNNDDDKLEAFVLELFFEFDGFFPMKSGNSPKKFNLLSQIMIKTRSYLNKMSKRAKNIHLKQCNASCVPKRKDASQDCNDVILSKGTLHVEAETNSPAKKIKNEATDDEDSDEEFFKDSHTFIKTEDFANVKKETVEESVNIKKESVQYNPDNDEGMAITNLHDAFAYISSINISTLGKISQSQKGVFAIWKKFWPTSDLNDKNSLTELSQVELNFVKHIIERSGKLVSKKSLSVGKNASLKISIEIIKNSLKELSGRIT